MVDVVRDGRDQTASLVQLIQESFYTVLLQEHGGSLQHVGRMRRVVVGVFCMVMGFDHGQPCVQCPFVTAQCLVYLEVRQQVHSQVHQRSVNDTASELLLV